MTLILGNPETYIQGPGEILKLCEYGSKLGKRQFIIISRTGLERFKNILNKAQSKCENSFTYAIFNGECSQKEIKRLTEEFKRSSCDIVTGIGGGKVIDTAKGVANYSNSPLIVVPTSAGMDAPCLAVSIVYTDDGQFEAFMSHPSHPNIVLVDSKIISNAPDRLFACGMGDGLSTFFEARACEKSYADNGLGGKQTRTAMKMAELCKDIILEDGIKAYKAVQSNAVTKAVENVIEANIYLSGIGAEGSGDAGAHGIHNALTILPETKNYYHGELVTFGILVQMILENDTKEFINEILSFCTYVGLPVTLDEIGVDKTDEEKMRIVADVAVADTLVNMPETVTSEDIYFAMLAADAVGKSFKNEKEI